MSDSKAKAPAGVSVTFAREWKIGDRTYQPEEDAVLPQDDADHVLRFGYARPHDAAVARVYGFAGPSEPVQKKGQ